MSFADWKKRSKQFTGLYGRFGQSHLGSIETACQAAYKAGERDGRKQVEAIAQNAVDLAIAIERGTKAWADVPNATEFVEDLRSNAELTGRAAAGREGPR